MLSKQKKGQILFFDIKNRKKKVKMNAMTQSFNHVNSQQQMMDESRRPDATLLPISRKMFHKRILVEIRDVRKRALFDAGRVVWD